MLVRLKQSWFVWLLLVCLVLVNGSMAAPSVSHAQHHADHQAGTHSTGICAWFCAAGQDVESTSVLLNSTLQLVEQTLVVHSGPNRLPIAFHSFSRGPPLLLA
ncbi:MAG TPA: hypothetical protein PLO50_00185 [Nitrospira sp.]|nr:hypothetical protein [Nitrospira sp.]